MNKIVEDSLNEMSSLIDDLEYWLENVRDHTCDCYIDEFNPLLHFPTCPYRKFGYNLKYMIT